MSPLALPLVAAFPVLFLHSDYQPGFELSVAGASLDVVLADLSLLAVAIAAAVSLHRHGWGRLRGGAWIWGFAAAFLALVFAGTLHPLASDREYPFGEHFVTGLKYAEYAVIAPAVPLLLRTAEDVGALLWAVAGTSAAATAFGLAEFSGLITLDLDRTLHRVPSFAGFEDFALLSAAALLVALVRPRGRLALVGGLSGGLGLVLSGALAGLLGLLVAVAALVALLASQRALDRRHGLTIAAAVTAVALATVAMRSVDVGEFVGFIGEESAEQRSDEEVQSYAQRLVLGYIGWRVFLDHPVLGVGWQGSLDEDGYGPQLAEARARFPSEPDRAFPSPDHPWGVHNVYLQALADLGLPGLLALLGLLAAMLVAAVRGALRAAGAWALPAVVAVIWTLLVAGLANGTGLVAGIGLAAMLWLAAGLAALVAEVTRAPA